MNAVNKRQLLSLWLPVLAYSAFIFWLSSAPRPVPPVMRWPGADKLIHLTEYSPLGFLLLRALSRTWVSWRGFTLLGAALLLGAMIGTFDELYQGFVPTRQVSPWDFLADLTGVLLGAVIYYRWKAAKTP